MTSEQCGICSRHSWQRRRPRDGLWRKFCITHTERAQVYGHPEARRIYRSWWRQYYHRTLRFIKEALLPAHPEHQRVLAALDACVRVMDIRPPVILPRTRYRPGPRQDRLIPGYLAHREMNRLKKAKVSPAQVLACAVAVWRFCEFTPGWLPDDGRCLSIALGRAVLMLARKEPKGVKYTRPKDKTNNTARMIINRREIPGLASLCIGTRLRRELGSALILFARMKEEATQ